MYQLGNLLKCLSEMCYNILGYKDFAAFCCTYASIQQYPPPARGKQAIKHMIYNFQKHRIHSTASSVQAKIHNIILKILNAPYDGIK